MREIKFRAWSTRFEKLIGGHAFDISGNGELIATRNPELFMDTTPIFMQYTGLKDKNGKEIYEGDIIDDLYNKGVVKLGFFELLSPERVWLVNGFYIEYKDGARCPLENFDLKVIGNIYEDSKLLGAINEEQKK